MSASSLTTYNSELVKALEDLREQREEISESCSWCRNTTRSAAPHGVAFYASALLDYA